MIVESNVDRHSDWAMVIRAEYGGKAKQLGTQLSFYGGKNQINGVSL